ncbi:hypothetical protein [Nocardioides bizhenqiangii]|uniref:Secreted protein n=1 Tax=Nocardioides bizhenqiangii TaxID=3095076 RepID=A0ABZ0ZWN5_9ACTN|nr:hypothetical protein [Nocardioides sp. HM61]WQQ28244.1 hypothetical protein SHK19_08415 [Nocardioides sp. HM61]
MTPGRPLVSRAAAAVAGGVLAAGLLAACGGSADGDGNEEDEPAADSSATGTTSAAPTDYLPVPEGVVLTEPGAALGFGDEATIAWRPRQDDAVVALDLTVDRIDRTTFDESFEGWVVTPEMRGQVPYFVRATATNVGEQAVGRLLVPLYGFSAAESMYEPLDFREETFEPCPGGSLPETLKPSRSVDLCFVYMLPEDQELASAAFGPVGDVPPITWSGEITEIEKPEKKKDKKGNRDDQGDQGDQGG